MSKDQKNTTSRSSNNEKTGPVKLTTETRYRVYNSANYIISITLNNEEIIQLSPNQELVLVESDLVGLNPALTKIKIGV